jgi:hypothetical protein
VEKDVVSQLCQATEKLPVDRPLARISARSALAAPLVLPEDAEQFRDLVLIEIERLHEGNIARFRLRPSEFRSWHNTIVLE